MYLFLHVGNSKSIRRRDIIGIFDTDNATVSTLTRKYLTRAQNEDRLISASEEIPKSFVLYRDGKTTGICFSQLSAASLAGRLQKEDAGALYIKHNYNFGD